MTDYGLTYQTEFQKSFVHFGSSLLSVTYSQATFAVDYVPGSGTAPVNPPVDTPGLKVLRDDDMVRDIDGVTLEDSEMGLFFPVLDLPGGSSVGDLVTETTGGKVWEVTGVFPGSLGGAIVIKVAPKTA